MKHKIIDKPIDDGILGFANCTKLTHEEKEKTKAFLKFLHSQKQMVINHSTRRKMV